MNFEPEPIANGCEASDRDVIAEVLHRNPGHFEVLLRRYNARLYRVARSIVGDEAEAEDVAQEAWVRAYTHLHQYEGTASFFTWLSKIAAHEALARLRGRARTVALPDHPERAAAPLFRASAAADPEKHAFGNEVLNILEAAIDALPPHYRSVFILRSIEQLSVSETANVLGTSEDVVKARLHRARAALRRTLGSRLGDSAPGLYRFPAPRCNRLVAAVSRRLAEAGYLHRPACVLSNRV